MKKNFLDLKNINTTLKNIVQLFGSLSEEERKKYDLQKFEDDLLYKFEDDCIDVNLAYEYAKFRENFKEKLDHILNKSKLLTTTRCQYLLSMETTDEEFVNLSLKAINGVLVENEEHVELMNKIKDLAIKRGLYDQIVNRIKVCGDISCIVCASLVYETKLIDEIFEGKENMFLYLTANTFTDEEDIQFYITKLFEIDNKDLEHRLDKKAKSINEKILTKK